MSSSTGKGLGQGGVWDGGGVDGGDGNRVGWMGGDSRPVGGDGGKNAGGLMGETGEDGFEAGLVRGLGGMGLWSGLDGGDVPSVNTAGGSGGVAASRDPQGAAGGVFILGWDGEPAGAGSRKPTRLGGKGKEVAADAAAGLCSLVGDFAGEAAGAGGAARPEDPISGPGRVGRWRVCLSRAVLCQSGKENTIRSFQEQQSLMR